MTPEPFTGMDGVVEMRCELVPLRLAPLSHRVRRLPGLVVAHYAILRRHNGRAVSLVNALRLASVMFR